MSRFAVLAALLLFLPFLSAESLVAINSQDGRDVLSGIFYAGVKGLPVHFISNSIWADILLARIGSGQQVLLIESSDLPVSGFLENEIKARNNQVEKFLSADGGQTNLELAVRSGASTFIIVDSTYSDSAISVLPYAYALKAYVIFADSSNIEKVKQIVSGKQVILYGYLESKVLQELSPIASQRIGKGEDKYEDNVELVRIMLSKYQPGRVIISDGASIEDGMLGTTPIVLSGRLVPQVTYDFLKEQVKEDKLFGVELIGNNLIDPVYDMRERMKNEFAKEGISKSMSIIVRQKAIQMLPSGQGLEIQLNTFLLPAYKPSINITDIFYDKAAKKVMVGFENTGEGPLYFNSEVRIQVNGADFKIFGQPETRLIERGQSVGLEYPLDLSSVQEGNVTASVLVKFGSSKRSLEEFETFFGQLASIEFVDKSNVSVRFAKYEHEKQRLSVAIKNNADIPVFVFTQIMLIEESGSPLKINAPSIRQIDSHSIHIEEFPLQLSAKELELNKEISVSVDYGARRGFLTKKANYSVPLESQSAASSDIMLFALVGVLLLVAAAAVYFLFFRKRK